MQATVNLATETALVRANMSDGSDGHAERLEVLGQELAKVSELAHTACRYSNNPKPMHQPGT